MRVGHRDWIIVANNNLAVEAREILGPKGRMERAHLVKQTSSGPDIALPAILLAFPDFGACVVRSAGLG